MRGDLVEIVTTVSSEEEAVSLSRRLVDEALVACATFFVVRSVYRWEGEIADEPEVQLQLKTLAAKAEAVERRLAELHPYEVPAILRIDVTRTTEAYVSWVADSVGGGGPESR